MPVVTVSNLLGLNVNINPLDIDSKEMIRCVNMDNYHFGAKKKRPGYVQLFDNSVSSANIDHMFNWQKDDGSTSFIYALSNNRILYFDVNGTATNWQVCSNGTVSGNYLGHASLENTLIVGDGVTNTRHSTNGTAFIDTPLAPKAFDFVDYQDRIYCIGSASNSFYSSLGDATNWNTSGTSDSSSIKIPGPGGLNRIFKADNRVMFNKNSGNQFRWDGYNLWDMTTDHGITSPKSLDQHDGVWHGLNEHGLFQFTGMGPSMLSNKADSLFINDRGTGVSKSGFGNNPGSFYGFQYLLDMGTSIADDITQKNISNCVLVYDIRLQDLRTYSMGVFPTAMTQYFDKTGVRRFIFGDANGYVYQLDPNTFTDNGLPIYSEMEFLFHAGTMQNKKFNWFRALFNPGCEAHVQIAVEDTFMKGGQRWIDLGDATSGVVEYRFPPDYRRGRLLFIRIYEASKTGRFEYYGYEIDAELIETP
jgi:hypothetical protein